MATVLVAGSSTVLLALAALWARSVTISEEWTYGRGSTVPVAGSDRDDVEFEAYRWDSASGVLLVSWQKDLLSGVERMGPESWRVALKDCTELEPGLRHRRLGDPSFLSAGGQAPGPLRTLRWASSSGRPLVLGVPWAWSFVAVPYWLLMLPCAVPLVWWAWCPSGRAWPRLTTRRLLLATAALAVISAGFTHLWRASATARLSDRINRLVASVSELDGRGALRIGMNDDQLNDSDVASVLGLAALQPSVRGVVLGDNIDDDGLASLRNLTNLEEFALIGARRVSDAGLAHLTSLHKLRVLSLRGTPVSDIGLVHLRGLTQLRELDLGDTRVTDAGLSSLASLTSLRELKLMRTRITDAGLAYLDPLPLLRLPHTEGSGVTAAALAAFGRSSPIRALDALERAARSGDRRAFEELTIAGAPEARQALWDRLKREIREYPVGRPRYTSRRARDEAEGPTRSRWINFSLADVVVEGRRVIVTDGRFGQVMVQVEGGWKAALDESGSYFCEQSRNASP